MRLLLDENMPPLYRQQLTRHNPDLVVRSAGDGDAPALGTLDPEILLWCEQNDFHLVTNNRKSMPEHLRNHLEAGGQIPGILAIRRRAEIGAVIEALLLIVEAALPGEFQNRIQYIPFE